MSGSEAHIWFAETMKGVLPNLLVNNFNKKSWNPFLKCLT